MLVSGRVDSTEWDLFKWLTNRMAWYGQISSIQSGFCMNCDLVSRDMFPNIVFFGNHPKNDLKLMCCEWVNNELVLNRFTQRLHHRLTREFKHGSSFGGYFKTILMGWEREKCWKWTLDFGENSILHPLKREKALKNSWKMLEDYGIISSYW